MDVSLRARGPGQIRQEVFDLRIVCEYGYEGKRDGDLEPDGSGSSRRLE